MRVRRTLVAAARGLGLAPAVELGSLTLFVLLVVSPALIVVGVGLLTTPVVPFWARRSAHLRRVWGHDLAGVRIPAAYRPFPAGPMCGPVGQARRCAVLLRDGLVRMLEAYGFEGVSAVESGPEPARALKERQPDSRWSMCGCRRRRTTTTGGCRRWRPTWTAADRPLACPAHGTVVSTEHWGHT
ncbi:hypothetical protein [Streptomyces nigrescens]|uniref:hypothetical protein n=1 Tax=Streptomyces nigrescens TaxID=1920 RepID=UPI00349B37FF